jgi:hypothetical protein
MPPLRPASPGRCIAYDYTLEPGAGKSLLLVLLLVLQNVLLRARARPGARGRAPAMDGGRRAARRVQAHCCHGH